MLKLGSGAGSRGALVYRLSHDGGGAAGAPEVGVQDDGQHQEEEAKGAPHDQLVLAHFVLDGVEQFVGHRELVV